MYFVCRNAAQDIGFRFTFYFGLQDDCVQAWEVIAQLSLLFRFDVIIIYCFVLGYMCDMQLYRYLRYRTSV